jgi:hypothetical protein
MACSSDTFSKPLQDFSSSNEITYELDEDPCSGAGTYISVMVPPVQEVFSTVGLKQVEPVMDSYV